ncbi:sensor histidine kinase [Anaerocolumna sp.]|uniref:sensor histidine kinase n=1 Tax=Anaerocolumna sp. TaxID=2041569 RepID=UPI0028B11D62|nr:HAMP domain-containing sensor histidine kinase [Anaerocolumna sp.]
MKNRLVEAIRQLLIKIILPLRKKKENFLGQFRFSIEFRISLQYLKLLLINGAIFMAAISLLYYFSEWKNCEKKAVAIINQFISTVEEEETLVNLYEGNLPSYGEREHNLSINPYYIDGISFKVYDSSTNKELYNDISYDITEKKKILNKVYSEDKVGDEPMKLIIYEEKKAANNNITYKFHFQYDFAEASSKLYGLIINVSIVYLVLVYIIIRRGKKSDRKLFQPIYEMSATANKLTVNNLHSERLNVEGTKNELKDLAMVINDMLDRIETSYESQKQFVSDASHELRTPIAVIQGYANLLNRWGTKDEDVLMESIDAINNEAKSMQDLVEKLLFLSRHDKKTLKLVKKRFNMCTVVEDMVKETRLVITNRKIESPILQNVIVYGDKQALKQAIRVFIDNAVKYTKEGDTITITCENKSGDCVITVQDTGIGMTRKDVDNIFKRFYRSEHVRNEKISGHGLGLSIAKLIIMGHTGKIKIRSQFTKGTTFTITLPRRRH